MRSAVTRLALAVGLCALLGAPRASAQPAASATAPAAVTLKTSVEPRSVTIGTPFRYTLRSEAPKDLELVVPTLAGTIGEFQIVDFGTTPPREEHGRSVVERWFTLVTYTPGDKTIPGPTIQYRRGGELQSVAAPDAVVIVQSLLDKPGATPATDVRDIKGPVTVPRDYRPLAWIGVGVLALLGLIALVYRLLNRPRTAQAVRAQPPHEVALAALARLRADRLVEAGRQEEFYVRLSTIVRDYLEARFRLRAPEMTSEEFLQAAQRDPQLLPPQRARLGQFLSEADLVKFARHQPAPADADRAHDAAREFVESTAPPPEVPRAVA